MTVKEAVKIFDKISTSKEYNPNSHSCQHVAKDTFNKIAGHDDKYLRND